MGNSPMQFRQARKRDHNEDSSGPYPFSVHVAPPKHIHLRGSYTIHACNANGVGPRIVRQELWPQKRSLQCEIVNRRMGYCMKRIEVDLKCMRSANRDQKAGMEGRREKKKKERNLHEIRDVGWLCVNVGTTRSTGNQPRW